MTTPRSRPALSARDLAVMGLLGGILFAAKIALAWIPNIEPVTPLILVYAAVLGWRALFPVYVYVAMEYATWGFGLWSACYLYVWAIPALMGILLRRMDSPVGWAVAAGAFGLCFGLLCTPPYFLGGGWAFALSWWVQGIPFDVVHCVGNFVMTLALFRPCRQVLGRLLPTRN